MKITREKSRAAGFICSAAKAFGEYIRRAIYMQKLFRGERLNQRTELDAREFTW